MAYAPSRKRHHDDQIPQVAAEIHELDTELLELMAEGCTSPALAWLLRVELDRRTDTSCP